MAILAAYGKITFEVTPKMIKQLKSIKQTVGFRSDKNDNKGTKPSTLRKGADLQSLALDFVYDRTLGVDASVEKAKWIDACESGQPDFFTVSGGRISKYPFICKSVEVTYESFDRVGKPISIALSVTLEEYVKEGQDESKSNGAIASSAGGIDPSVAALLNTDTSKIRDNPAKEAARRGGLRKK